jgi:hypothetical protein
MCAPIHPEDLGRGALVVGVSWSLSSLALIVVGIRFWLRIAVTNQLKIEDWLMLLAVVSTSVQHESVCSILTIAAYRASLLLPNMAMGDYPDAGDNHCQQQQFN